MTFNSQDFLLTPYSLRLGAFIVYPSTILTIHACYCDVKIICL